MVLAPGGARGWCLHTWCSPRVAFEGGVSMLGARPGRPEPHPGGLTEHHKFGARNEPRTRVHADSPKPRSGRADQGS